MIGIIAHLLLAFLLLFVLIGAAVTLVEAGGKLQNVARDRLYKSGTRWCFWRWTETPSKYILRLHIFKTPFGAVCLHWIRIPDQEACLHDHPVSFLSIILRGSYCEIREKAEHILGADRIVANRRLVNRKWVNFIRASERDRHKILLVRSNTLTLCFMGPKTREWGFHTPGGWVHWKQYNDEKYRGRADLNDRTVDQETVRANMPYWEGRVDDFIDEAPTEPKSRYGEGPYGGGSYGD